LKHSNQAICNQTVVGSNPTAGSPFIQAVHLGLSDLLFMGIVDHMRPYSLASVLIKVLGVSSVIDGLSRVSFLLSLVFTPLLLLIKGFPVTGKVVLDCALQGAEVPVGLVLVGLGMFLLLKADWVVKKIMKIDDTHPDA